MAPDTVQELPDIDPQARLWRDLLLAAVEPYRNTPLLMSGGVDSATILAAQLALGGEPLLRTFSLPGWQSEDLRVARCIAEHFRLHLHVVEIPRTEAQLLADVRILIKLLGETTKTHIQCAQPIMHMTRQLNVDGFDEAVIGTGGVVECNIGVALLFHEEGEEAARKYRRGQLLGKGGSGPDANSAVRSMHVTAANFGVRLFEPFSTPDLAEYGLSLDIGEMNTPCQKGIAVRAFPEFWGAGNWYRSNAALQVEGGIREWHDELLDSEHNRRGSKTVIGAYNDIAKDMREPRLL